MLLFLIDAIPSTCTKFTYTFSANLHTPNLHYLCGIKSVPEHWWCFLKLNNVPLACMKILRVVKSSQTYRVFQFFPKFLKFPRMYLKLYELLRLYDMFPKYQCCSILRSKDNSLNIKKIHKITLRFAKVQWSWKRNQLILRISLHFHYIFTTSSSLKFGELLKL